MVKITAPDPSLSGLVVGLRFVDGVAEPEGELSRPQALWLATHGYEVGGNDAEPQPWEVPDESWTKARIVDFASSRGVDLGAASTKAEMLAAIENPETTTDLVADPGQSPTLDG